MKKGNSGRGGRGGGEPSAGKVMTDRKTVERNRRHRMKDLCTQLFSLLPPQHFITSKEMLSLQDQIDRAASYIKQKAERVEELRVRKEQAAIAPSTSAANNRNDNSLMMESEDLRLPVLELKEIMGSGLQVNLISNSCSNGKNTCSSTIFLVLCKSISVLHEEGAEVVSASFARRGSKLFYTIHAQVKISRIGIETSRVRERLEELRTLV